MKREDLKNIEGLTLEQINKILNLHQNDVTEWQTKISDLQAKITEKDTAITDLNTKLQPFQGVDVSALQQSVKDWETKYNTDMAAKDRSYAKDKLFDSMDWTSDLAKQGAIAAFDAKNLEYKDGKFAGSDEFFNELKTNNPSAFGQAQAINVNRNTGMEHGSSSSGTSAGELSGVEKYFYDLNPGLKK